MMHGQENIKRCHGVTSQKT